jgi:NAD+ synthase (glutamine-hydrolysing)
MVPRMPGLRIALAQINTIPGDLPGNAEEIRRAWDRGEAAGADLVVFPELALVGYAPRDLLFRRRFVEDAVRRLQELRSRDGRARALVGTAWPREGPGNRFANAAILIGPEGVEAVFAKELLPPYDVFDEQRYFEPGRGGVARVRGVAVGVTICEDLWSGAERRTEVPRYATDPVLERRREGADVIVNLSASPFHHGKAWDREQVVRSAARRAGVPVFLCNLWGGNDEVLFDGGSIAVDAQGLLVARGRRFADDLVIAGLEDPPADSDPPPERDVGALREALIMGIRDYARKCGFRRIVLGLSGGIDSALTACLCRDALGRDAVTGVAMPSHFSSPESLRDSESLARALGIDFSVLPITPIYEVARTQLGLVLADAPFGTMEENLQARIRGLLLMAISNRTGALLVSTGNKSELATGYCTLYGDMCGGLAALSDVYKTDVYALAAHYAQSGEIPESSMSKAPSAELRPDQKDQDTLPPYELLDRILRLHIEEDLGSADILARGVPAPLAEVDRVLTMVYRSEYKRKQAAPGLRVSRKAFGHGRRVPLVASSLAFLDHAEPRPEAGS